MPRPPKTDVPRLNKPPSNNPGISDAPEPMRELEKLERPKMESPKFEPPNSEPPKRGLLKFAIERPDENGENRDDSGIFVEKRFQLNPGPGACVFHASARLDLKAEAFTPKEAFLGFPNEYHWPSARALLA